MSSASVASGTAECGGHGHLEGNACHCDKGYVPAKDNALTCVPGELEGAEGHDDHDHSHDHEEEIAASPTPASQTGSPAVTSTNLTNTTTAIDAAAATPATTTVATETTTASASLADDHHDDEHDHDHEHNSAHEEEEGGTEGPGHEGHDDEHSDHDHSHEDGEEGEKSTEEGGEAEALSTGTEEHSDHDHDDHAHDQKLPAHITQTFYTDTVMTRYADPVTGRISLTGLEKLFESTALVPGATSANAKDDHAGHNHDHRRRRRQANGTAVCMSPEQVFQLYGVNQTTGFNSTEFQMYVAPTMVGMMDSKTCIAPTGVVAAPSAVQAVSIGAAWGWSILAVGLITASALLGILFLPMLNKKAKDGQVRARSTLIFAFMVAMGASVMLCDAALHLIPIALGRHAHSDDGSGAGHVHEEEMSKSQIIWRTTVLVAGAYFLYVTERIIAGLTGGHGHTHAHGMPPTSVPTTTTTPGNNKLSTADEKVMMAAGVGTGVVMATAGGVVDGVKGNEEVCVVTLHHHASCDSDHSCEPDCPVSVDAEREPATVDIGSNSDDGSQQNLPPPNRMSRMIAKVKSVRSLAWIILIGDGLHNFIDGIAIGASFSMSVSLGFSTAIAVFLHEVPQELADFAVLVQCGFSHKGALLANFLGGCTAFIGMAIGIYSEATWRPWLLMFTAGMFLYISLYDMLPLLQEPELRVQSRPVLTNLVQALGLAMGWVSMFLLAWFEEDIKF